MPLWKQHELPPRQPYTGGSHPATEIQPPPFAGTTNQDSQQAVAAPAGTTLKAGLSITGHISGAGPLFLDCCLTGSVDLPSEIVTIGPRASIEPSSGLPGPCIRAKEIIVEGKVHGSIYAVEKVDLRAGCSVIGTVSTSRVSIEDGAFFRGEIDILRPRSQDTESTPALVEEELCAEPVP